MNWLIETLTSAIGKKLMMAFTGLCFCLFLVTHLAGNLTVFGGSAAFMAYVHRLHSFGVLITIIELILLTLAVIHVATGLWLFYQNRRARPERYAVKKRSGGRTWASATMPYTGLVLLLFIIVHLADFHFADTASVPVYDIMASVFQQPFYIAFYVLAMAVAALHVSHGLWSAFQSLGANHPKYMPLIQAAGIVFALVVVIGFSSIPLYLLVVV